MIKTLSAALVGVALIAAPAIAQNANQSANPNATAQSSQASQNEQNASAAGVWQGSKLIGLNVYNNNNEKIGDIKQLMVNKSGQIDDVVIGVGGFLGMGERDVAVKFSELQWSNEPVRSTSTTSSSSNRSSTTGANSMSSNTSSANSNPTYPDHAVLNASKDQLQAMPQFNYDK